jgi:hypothetical protein
MCGDGTYSRGVNKKEGQEGILYDPSGPPCRNEPCDEPETAETAKRMIRMAHVAQVDGMKIVRPSSRH